ncbi:DUF1772 domain-containing protein [Nioella sp.]|uniref:anthrone oxygenase family protein n=1 Tax=Nioella sp. TaxID=1912091 RepID=UPI00351161C3
MPIWMFIVAQGAVLAYGLLGGVFLAFSDFIMRSLSLVGGHGGVEAMQVINREVFRIVFMALFLGMAPVSALLVVHGLAWGEGSGALLLAAAGGVYLLGCFAVTVAGNVPLNEALAGLDTRAPDTIRYWQDVYLPRWTFWNSLRTAACALASVLAMLGLVWSASA